MRVTKKRSVCPVACVLDLIGDKWTLLVVRDMACGKAFFKEFSASPERIATNILSDRLDRLVRSGLAETFDADPVTERHGYRLTLKGKSLLPVLAALRDWGLAHIKGTEARMAKGRFLRAGEGATNPPSSDRCPARSERPAT